ncbi:unnamed protein product [Ectocarpus sp. 12 AP-2014]
MISTFRPRACSSWRIAAIVSSWSTPLPSPLVATTAFFATTPTAASLAGAATGLMGIASSSGACASARVSTRDCRRHRSSRTLSFNVERWFWRSRHSCCSSKNFSVVFFCSCVLILLTYRACCQQSSRSSNRSHMRWRADSNPL